MKKKLALFLVVAAATPLISNASSDSQPLIYTQADMDEAVEKATRDALAAGINVAKETEEEGIELDGEVVADQVSDMEKTIQTPEFQEVLAAMNNDPKIAERVESEAMSAMQQEADEMEAKEDEEDDMALGELDEESLQNVSEEELEEIMNDPEFQKFLAEVKANPDAESNE